MLYWFLEVFFLSALALRLSIFPLYARPPPCADRRRLADAVDRPRRRCRDAAARNRERRRQAALAGRRVVAVGADRGQTIRNIPVLGGIDDIEDVIRDYRRRGKPIARWS